MDDGFEIFGTRRVMNLLVILFLTGISFICCGFMYMLESKTNSVSICLNELGFILFTFILNLFARRTLIGLETLLLYIAYIVGCWFTLYSIMLYVPLVFVTTFYKAVGLLLIGLFMLLLSCYLLVRI